MAQCGREDRAVDVAELAAPLCGGLGGDVGQAAQNLRQDHPGVAAGAVQRAVRQGRGHPSHVTSALVLLASASALVLLASASASRRVRLRPGRAHGEEHVGAGVGVGDREDVQPVDLVGVGDQVTHRGVSPVQQGCRIQPPTRLRHLSPTSHLH